MPDNGGVAGRLRGRDDVLGAGGRRGGRPRLRHVRQPLRRAGQRGRLQPAAPNGYFSESCEQPGAYWNSIVAFRAGLPARRSGRTASSATRRGKSLRLAAASAWCLPRTTRRSRAAGKSTGFGDVGRRRLEPERVPARHRRERARGGRLRRQERRLLPVRRARPGKLLWNTLVGPGGDQGGFEWGTAFDGQRIYVSLTNQHHIPYQLTENGELTSTTTTGGSWAALDPATGKILWQTADPQTETLPAPPEPSACGISGRSPSRTASSTSPRWRRPATEMYALDAATGNILWSYAAGSSVNAAPGRRERLRLLGLRLLEGGRGQRQQQAVRLQHRRRLDTTAPTTTIALARAPERLERLVQEPRSASRSPPPTTPAASASFRRGARSTRAPSPASFADLPDADCSLTSVDTATARTRSTRRARTRTTTSRARSSARRSRSTRRRRRSPPRRRPARTRTASTTGRSSCTSPAPTPARGSRPARVRPTRR